MWLEYILAAVDTPWRIRFLCFYCCIISDQNISSGINRLTLIVSRQDATPSMPIFTPRCRGNKPILKSSPIITCLFIANIQSIFLMMQASALQKLKKRSISVEKTLNLPLDNKKALVDQALLIQLRR